MQGFQTYHMVRQKRHPVQFEICNTVSHHFLLSDVLIKYCGSLETRHEEGNALLFSERPSNYGFSFHYHFGSKLWRWWLAEKAYAHQSAITIFFLNLPRSTTDRWWRLSHAYWVRGRSGPFSTVSERSHSATPCSRLRWLLVWQSGTAVRKSGTCLLPRSV